MRNSCLDCGKKFKNAHKNRKRCGPCAEIVRKKPLGTMTLDKIAEAKELAQTMPMIDIAKKLGVTKSNIKRSCPKTSFAYHTKWKNNPSLVREIIEVFEMGGKKEVLKKFPDISYRSIVERYPRSNVLCQKWSDSDLIKIAKLSCFVPFDKQIKIFNRGKFTKKAINSIWSKRFPIYPSNLHGWNHNRAKIFVKKDCDYLRLPFMHGGHAKYNRRLYLWVDMEKNLKEDCPKFVRQAVIALAIFQRWLWGNNPKLKIRNIMKKYK
jgi:hypothetical protein